MAGEGVAARALERLRISQEEARRQITARDRQQAGLRRLHPTAKTQD